MHGSTPELETMYKNKKKNTSAENVQLQVDKGVIAYMQHYDNNSKRGYGFCLDKFQDKKLVSTLRRWRFSMIQSPTANTTGS